LIAESKGRVFGQFSVVLRSFQSSPLAKLDRGKRRPVQSAAAAHDAAKSV